MEEKNSYTGLKIGVGAIALFIILLILLAINPIVVIGAGQRGVVFNNGSGVEDQIMGEGMHYRTPFIESVHSVSIKVQKTDFTEDAASKDLQRISMNVAVNWQLNPSKVNKIYQNIGDIDTVVATVLNNRVQQAVKANVSKYTAEEVQRNRGVLADKIQEDLAKKLKSYDILVTNVSIANLDYTPEFNAAIERKQLAQQEAEQAKYLKEKAVNEANAKVAEAEGTGKARLINAEAEGKAQAALNQTLTAELLQKMLIAQWDGHYPQYMLSGGVPLLQLPTR